MSYIEDEIYSRDLIQDDMNGIIESMSMVSEIKMECKEILFLNFNYTNTEQKYKKQYKKIKTTSIHIHGSLEESNKDPFIFGYGDEEDEEHQIIENLEDDRYLDNIKTIEYLKTDKYKQLMDFIESANFEVYILGHSCGKSDKTLLKTLFEHTNCISIKPYYREYFEGDSLKNNYDSISKAIYRNFSSKVLMRSKVLDYTHCSPLVPISIQSK